MPSKPLCCKPFSCFSAVEKRPDPTPAGAQTAPSESGSFSQAPPGASHDEAPSKCDEASTSGSDPISSIHKEVEDVKLKKIVSFEPDSQKLQNMLSEDVSGTPESYKASTSRSSNVPNRSEEQDVDFNLNVSGAPPCINEALTCSSSGATKSRSDLISSIRKDIVEVEDVNLDALMNHISELLKLREEGKQQQASNLRKFPWPNVPGLQKLKEIVSFGTDFQKLQNMLSATLTIGSELKDIIHGSVTDLLKDIGKVSVPSAGLLVVAHTLERFDDVSTNKKTCWQLIKEMSHVAFIIKRLKEIGSMPQFVMEDATSVLVQGAIMCCKQIEGSAWKRLLVASKIKGDLSDTKQKLEAMYSKIMVEISLLIFREVRINEPVEREETSSPLKGHPTDAIRINEPVEREETSSPLKGHPTDAIGINKRVQDVLRLLEMESDKNAGTVTLHGFGGTGKTTLAEAVFSEVVGWKRSKVLLFKDINSTPDIIELQKQILQDLVEPGETIPQIRLPQDGRRELKRVLANVDAFIYIDNVLDASNLIMLLPYDITKAKKVRVLLTASNDGVELQQINKWMGFQST